MNEQLVKVLNDIQILSGKETTDFMSLLKERHLKKGEYWLKEGISNRNIAFIQEGFLRKFYLKDGNEQTDSFYFENEFCTDLPSILSNNRPDSYIIAVKPTKLLMFSFDEYQKLSSLHSSFEHIYNHLLEQSFVKFYYRTRSFIEQTPQERYNEIVKNEPKILKNATQYQIASYIGISYQHLSRLRSKK